MRVRERVFRNEGRIRQRLVVEEGVYHLMSRTGRRCHLFGPKEKEVFCALLHKQAEFSGVEVIAYCIMDNHFHVLARVKALTAPLPDAVILERYARMYEGVEVPQSTYSLGELRDILTADGREAVDARQRVLARMGSVSVFMQELKQRFTFWYNSYHGNVGTIWAAPFKSLLVEDSTESIATVAAYIELNPVRAELVEDPINYRWCSYGAALGGRKSAQKGICSIYRELKLNFRDAIMAYRLVLFGKGYLSKGLQSQDRGRISAEKLDAVVRRGGALSLAERLRTRVRYFSDGMVFGSEAFVETVFEKNRGCFGMRRKKGAHRLNGSEWSGLCVMRNLKQCVFS